MVATSIPGLEVVMVSVLPAAKMSGTFMHGYLWSIEHWMVQWSKMHNKSLRNSENYAT